MSEEKRISLPNYIFYSLAAAWKLVQANPQSMDYFDLSSEGFWKSFWAVVLIVPVIIFFYIYSQGAEGPQPFLSSVIFYITVLPLTAVIMYYFTRFMRLSEHYSSMVIAHNWLYLLATYIVEMLTLLLVMLIPDSEMIAIIIIVLNFYLFGYVVWCMFKQSLHISGWLAFGVLIFQAVFIATYRAVLLRYLDTEWFIYMREVANNPPA